MVFTTIVTSRFNYLNKLIQLELWVVKNDSFKRVILTTTEPYNIKLQMFYNRLIKLLLMADTRYDTNISALKGRETRKQDTVAWEIHQ